MLPPPLGEGSGAPKKLASWGAGGGGGTRFDHAISPGLVVSPYYDSMLGKLVAHAPTREEAIEQLAGALDRTVLLGLPTNRRFLAACLRDPEFIAGRALISFLDGNAQALRDALRSEERDAAAAAALAAVYANSPEPSRLACPFPRPSRFRHRGVAFDVNTDAAAAIPVVPRPPTNCARHSTAR